MIVRVTHVCDLEFDDHYDLLDVTASALGIMTGQAKGRDRVKSERATVELIYPTHGSPIAYAEAFPVEPKGKS